jgi:hypothetical protein
MQEVKNAHSRSKAPQTKHGELASHTAERPQRQAAAQMQEIHNCETATEPTKAPQRQAATEMHVIEDRHGRTETGKPKQGHSTADSA